MKLTKILPVMLLGLASVASAADNTNRQGSNASDSVGPLNNKQDAYHTLKIKRPHFGQSLTTKSIGAILSLDRKLDSSTLNVYLNGNDITAGVEQDRCFKLACEVKVRLNTANGLRNGQNQLRASVHGFDKSIESTSVAFDYNYGLLSGVNVPQYLPSVVGFNLAPGGSLPWITITTGTSADLVDNIDQTRFSIPYADTSFPSTDQACSSGQPLQVAVLNRLQPNQLISFTCFANAASLKAFLSDSTKVSSGNLVVVGTSSGNNAPSGLDTSSIGGTDYSNTPANAYPLGYAMIGLPGAAPGSAFENYDITATSDMPHQYSPWAYGTLVEGETGYYDFHPGDNRQFKVTPSTTAAGTSVVVGGQTYTAPAGSQNGMWLLVLDRMLLQPADASPNNGAKCPYNATTTNGCGTFYPTGNADESVYRPAALALANAMMGVNPRNLAVLTSVGQPFANGSILTELTAAVSRLGGARYTLTALYSPTATFTLVAPGATVDRSPFSRQVVNSTNAYHAQGQTGIVSGVLARDRSSLFAPIVSAQIDGTQNGQNGPASSITPDYSFYEIASQGSVDWPLTDTSGHIAAYHYASWYFINNNFQEGGPHVLDLRYFYASDQNGWDTNTQFDCSLVNNQCPPYPAVTGYPGDGTAFNQQELTEATAQLYKELTALRDNNNYLVGDGAPGLRTVVSGPNGIATQIISATYNVLAGQFGPDPNSLPVSMSTSDWMSLAAGVLAIPAAALGPADMPLVAAGMGVLNGEFTIGGGIASPFTTTPTNPPSYENTFDTTIGNLANSNNVAKYTQNLVVSFDASLDAIYTDWGRLNAVFQKTSNSGNTGWLFTDRLQVDSIQNVWGAGVSRSLYMQLLPQFYALDTYPNQPVTDVTKIGTFWQDYITLEVTCTATHDSLPSDNYAVYNELGKTDIFVIGGTINNQGTKDVSESLPSGQLLDLLFTSNDSSDLNFPKDPFYSTGSLLNYRSGPDQGFTKAHGQCYKPGCHAYYDPVAGNNPFADCKGP
jgi:hypothetical protein